MITGTSATLQTADTIIDQHSDDNDTLNLTLNAKNNLAKITGIENINVNWDAFGTAQYDATNTTGATITGTSSKTGFLGAFSVTGTGANNVVAGDGMTGALTVDGATDTTVTGTAAKSIKVDGTATASNNLSATVIAGANTTKVEVGTTAGFKNVDVTGGAKTTEVSVDNSAKIVVDAAAATKLTLEGTTETDDSAEITLGVDAKVSLAATPANLIEDVTINAADGTEVDITGSTIKNLTIASEGAATLVADETILKANTVTNKADSLNIKLAHTTGAADLSKVAADLFTLTSSHGSALTFATGAKVLVAEDVALDASAVFNGKSATNGTLDLTVLADQTNDIEVTALKTLNLAVELNADDADKKATLGGITSANDVTLTSANEVVVTALAVKNLDASASTGKLEIAGATGAASIVGSQGNNTVTLNSVTSEVSVITGEGDDKVTLGTAAATAADVTLVLGNGKNTVDANAQAIKGAALSVVTGSGDDVVKVKLDTSGSADNNVVLELGDGKNSVELNTGTTGGKDNFVTIVTGAGNDTVKFMANTIAADTINWTADGGTNTLDLGGKDISLGEITLSGVTHILDGAGTGVVDGSLLNGKSYTIQGNGSIATLLDVTIAKAGSYDFSNLVLDATLAKGIGGLNITGSTAGSDKIIGTSGNDTIVASSTGTNTITGGKGQDDLSSNGSTTFVFAKGDSGKTATTFDTIQDFVTTTDKLKMGIKGDGNFVEVDVDTGVTDQLATVTAAATAANTVFSTGALAEGKTFAFLYDGTGGVDGWLAIDWNTDGTVDEVIKMVGLKASGDIVATDIIA
ncbi:MAG: hypothetical protein RBR43_09170 [Desulfuromonadaceae bacterium]|nr:hypothetical protein [Desulfuromonadaceae bacterium]